MALTRCLRGIIQCSIVVTLFALPNGAEAQTTFTHVDGRRFSCLARHQQNGQVVVARGVNGYANGRAAWARWDPYGYPTMTFDVGVIRQSLSAWPQYLILFLYYHECAHLRMASSSELVANCEGLKQMRRDGEVTRGMEDTIYRYHVSLGRGGEWLKAVACADGPRSSPQVVAPTRPSVDAARWRKVSESFEYYGYSRGSRTSRSSACREARAMASADLEEERPCEALYDDPQLFRNVRRARPSGACECEGDRVVGWDCTIDLEISCHAEQRADP